MPKPGQPLPGPFALPERIGRYRVLRLLGEGGFGRVYLALDEILDRQVAIKVPRPDRIARPEDVDSYLVEARVLTKLEHPGIVPVYDADRTDDGLCFVASKYIEGHDLAHTLRADPPAHPQAAALVAAVAEALHYAHTRGLVHRDVKPANILIDLQGKPYVADFGLALKDEDFGRGAGYAGTPAYMSPEQARGEGHRVDGRSDIFSLGVVLYQLLTRRRPFTGHSHDGVLEQITTEPRPPRQIDDTIPKELERICQKALSKRASERYNTARDMADDLRYFLKGAPVLEQSSVDTVPASPTPLPTQPETPVPTTAVGADSDNRPLRIVPKGLRSFDAHDADFFLELLPGPRDRDGLPDSIRFWKRTIEESDPDLTFRVGLIYGPSGCGKSSLVKAGLLPRLAKHILTVYVEATPDETESRLLKALRKQCPSLPADLGLVEALAALRRGQFLPAGKKVLIVLDQFEQWLHAQGGAENTELVAALRHCDGGRVQAVVMVRDDFWLAVSRFMAELEVESIQGQNTALTDLFDLSHARKVLMAFGMAYGTLPERANDSTKEQKAFLDQAVSELARDGKIVSVRLSLFAEMIKGKPWTPATLKEVGGTEGVGIRFLEETFSAPQANPKHRLHEKSARWVLKALLPESGSDIKGQMRSHQELLEASGQAARPREFAELLQMLDRELRLITPTDPEGTDSEDGNRPAAGGKYYQLTHDYLVPSLREWLTRKQRETRRGRAELLLAERAALWNARPENRFLPSAWEWARVRALTQKKDWTATQRKMMKRAGFVHGRHGLGLAAALAVLVFIGLRISQRVVEANNETVAAELVRQVLSVKTAQVPDIVKRMAMYRRWVDPALRKARDQAADDSAEKLHASLALLPTDGDRQATYLYQRLLSARPEEVPVLRDALRDQAPSLTSKLWAVVEEARPDDARLLPAASTLALYDPAPAPWEGAAPRVARALVAVNPVYVSTWIDTLRPVRQSLTPALSALFRDQDRAETERALATSILADYARDQPETLADLLLDAQPKAFATLFPIAEQRAGEVVPLFRAELARKPAEKATEADRDQLAERQARAAVALVRLGQAEAVWPLLKHSADPRLRSFIVNWLRPLGADPRAVVTGLAALDAQAIPAPTEGPPKMDAILFHPETSTRRALILSLGTYGTEGLSAGERGPLTARLLDLYRNDPDAGIHGAAEWTLRQWKQQEKLKEVDAELIKTEDWGERRWFVNGQGQTFAVIDGPVEFVMGSPETEPDHLVTETAHRVRVPRRFAIATKEVSKAQWEGFVKRYPEEAVDESFVKKFSPDPDGPMVGFSWYVAAKFCNWLSEQDGLPEDQWCYHPAEKGGYTAGMTVPAYVLKRRGYRLPTEAEWEFACRSGTITGRYYGLSTDLLGRYARYQGNSAEHAWSAGGLQPNDLGLFDMLGNVYEWCQERYEAYPKDRIKLDDMNKLESITEVPRLLRGGAFLVQPADVRSAYRVLNAPSYRLVNGGFRPSRTYP